METSRKVSDLLASAGDVVDIESLVSRVVDASPVGMVIVDDRGAIVFANRSIERDFGYPAERLAGQSVDVLLPLPQRFSHKALREAYQHMATPRQMGAGLTLRGRRIDGAEFPIEVALTPVTLGARMFVLASVQVSAERDTAAALGQRQERLAFENLVSEISADFVNLPSKALDEAIANALRKIVESLDLDRAVMWLRDEGSDDFHVGQRWGRGGLTLALAEPLSIKTQFPAAWPLLMAGDAFSFARVSDIADETTRASVTQFGATAGITVGFSIGGEVAGCVSFATARGERDWAPEICSSLQLVSRVFANAIARQRADKALEGALSEVKHLTERLRAENRYLQSEVRQAIGSSSVIGQSPLILQALDLVAQVAPTDSSVLLLGETGTGKELFANQVHELSARRDRLMVRVNCAAIPDTLLESELFGRERGAYTGALTRQTGRFELADKSTIFLDEIGDLPLEVQVKLLRVLEDRQVERLGSSRSVKVDVRIVAATHRNLEDMVAAGKFREDLYYRLNVFPVRVPPLRERPGDIPLLVWRFVDEFSKRFGKPVSSIDKDCVAELQQHSWPGNVRELRNVVERAMIVAKPNGPLVIPIAPVALPAALASKSSKLVDVEIAHMRSVLEGSGWRIRGTGGAAERLGLKPSTLETRMAKLGIKRPVK